MGLLVFAELLGELLAVGSSDVAVHVPYGAMYHHVFLRVEDFAVTGFVVQYIYSKFRLGRFGMFLADPGLHIAFFIFERQSFLRFCATGENESRGECACRNEFYNSYIIHFQYIIYLIIRYRLYPDAIDQGGVCRNRA